MIRTLRRRLAVLRSSRDRGLTVTELLVAMVILSLLMVMVIGFFSSASRAFQTNRTIDSTTRSAANGMNEMSRMLRAATNNPVAGSNTPDPAFVAASATSVTFYAYVNLAGSTQTPIQVRFDLNTANNTITETQWAATALPNSLWSFPPLTATPSLTRTLATPVLPVSAGGPQLFTYLGADGGTIAFGSNGQIPSTTVGTIASVQVALTLGTSSANGQNVALLSAVGLPNIGIARTQ